MAQKRDAAAIIRVLDGLASRYKLDARKSAWPDYLYYFGNIANIASILRMGALFSRRGMERRGIPFIDSADPELVADSWALAYARLYFRPQTPALLRHEGIVPAAERVRGAQCGVPVYLLFNARKLLTQVGIGFAESDRALQHLNESQSILHTGLDMRAFSFDLIYADTPLNGQDDGGDHYRHAEVICRNGIELKTLAAVVCRTVAEREMLMEMLGPAAEKWDQKIRVEAADEGLFFHRGVEVKSADFDGTSVRFRFSGYDRPFESAHLRIVDLEGALLVERIEEPWTPPKELGIPLPAPATSVRVQWNVDGWILYEGILPPPASPL